MGVECWKRQLSIGQFSRVPCLHILARGHGISIVWADAKAAARTHKLF